MVRSPHLITRLSRLRPTDKLLAFGYSTIGLMVSVLVLWSIIVPLADSIIAPGTVSVAAQRRTIAHLEGGTVSHLNVREGDYVQSGQILLRLDDKDLRSRLDVLINERFANEAKRQRLVAERQGAAAMTVDPTLLSVAESSPDLSEILRSEVGSFNARTRSFMTQVAGFDERILQGNQQLERWRQQLQSLNRQQHIIQRQAQDAQTLLVKGYTTKSRAAQLALESERLLSRRFEIEAEIDDLQGTVQDARYGKNQLLAERSQDIEETLSATQRKLAELDVQIRALDHRLDALTIRSTVQGVIVDLRVQSINDVIKPAAPILDVIPIDSAYLIEAQIPPDKIEGLAEGLKVEVRLRGLSDNQVQAMPGKVAMVSADTVDDANTQHQYYRVHVTLTDRQQAEQTVEIMPGMPVDVIFRRRDRTLIEYFLSPLLDHLSRSAV